MLLPECWHPSATEKGKLVFFALTHTLQPLVEKLGTVIGDCDTSWISWIFQISVSNPLGEASRNYSYEDEINVNLLQYAIIMDNPEAVMLLEKAGKIFLKSWISWEYSNWVFLLRWCKPFQLLGKWKLFRRWNQRSWHCCWHGKRIG